MAERGDVSLLHTLKRVAAVLKQDEIPSRSAAASPSMRTAVTPASTTWTSCSPRSMSSGRLRR